MSNSQDTNMVVEALKGGAVAGVGFFGIIILAVFFLFPLLVSVGFFLGWWSFENSVISMLVFIAYFAGTSE